MTFKFRKGIFTYLCIMAFILAFFVIFGVRQSGFNADIGVIILLLVFLLIFAFISYVFCMDIAVDDDGVYRIFFGREALFLKWSDIKVIKDVVKKSLSGQLVRSFYVVPRDGISLSFWSGGWIRFPDSMHDFRIFADVMNTQVRSHDIRVERIRGIDIVMCDEILVSDPISG